MVNGLEAIVKELAEAQVRTERRLTELTEAQVRTERRLTELAEGQARLVEAQARTERRLTELAEGQARLVEAQARTERRLTELAEGQARLVEAQARTERRVMELAQAQVRTEGTLQRLAQEQADFRRQLGGLSITVGYTLENEAFKALPGLLQRYFGILVRGRATRKYVTDRTGTAIEVNIIGEATKEGREVVIVGEAKSQLSRNDVDDFIRRKLKRLEGVFGEIFPVLVTHMTTDPDVEAYVRQKGITLYYSYDF